MVDCSGFIQPLNLQCLLVNTFAGSIEIFIFISFIIISALAARFRMVNKVSLIMLALFGIIMGRFFEGIYFIIILIIGLVSAGAISKLVKN